MLRSPLLCQLSTDGYESKTRDGGERGGRGGGGVTDRSPRSPRPPSPRETSERLEDGGGRLLSVPPECYPPHHHPIISPRCDIPRTGVYSPPPCAPTTHHPPPTHQSITSTHRSSSVPPCITCSCQATPDSSSCSLWIAELVPPSGLIPVSALTRRDDPRRRSHAVVRLQGSASGFLRADRSHNPVSRHIVLMRTNVYLCIVSQSTYF